MIRYWFTFLDQAHVFQGKQAPNTETTVRCYQFQPFLDLTLGLIFVVLSIILIIISTFVRHFLHWWKKMWVTFFSSSEVAQWKRNRICHHHQSLNFIHWGTSQPSDVSYQDKCSCRENYIKVGLMVVYKLAFLSNSCVYLAMISMERVNFCESSFSFFWGFAFF